MSVPAAITNAIDAAADSNRGGQTTLGGGDGADVPVQAGQSVEQHPGPVQGSGAARKPAARKPAAPAKRGRGRPPKSATSKPAAPKGGQDDSVRLRVDEAAPSPPRERPTPASVPDVTTLADAAVLVSLVFDNVHLLAEQLAGPGSGFTALERGMMEPAATRLIAKANPAVLAKYTSAADPALLAIGLAMWGKRVMASRPKPAPDEPPPTPAAPAASAALPPVAPPPERQAIPLPPPSQPIEDRAPNGVAAAPAALVLAVESNTLGAIA